MWVGWAEGLGQRGGKESGDILNAHTVITRDQ